MAGVPSRKNHLLISTTVVFLTMLCTTDIINATNANDTNLNKGNLEYAREYFLTVGNEQVHFVVQPEAGYVLKIQDEIGLKDTLNWILKDARNVKISPVCGSSRKGLYVIYYDQSTNEACRTFDTFKDRSNVQYIAPLYSSNGETVAIIPEIVVRIKSDTEIDLLRKFCETEGCKIIKRMEFTQQEYLLGVIGKDATAVFNAIVQLNNKSFIEWAAPNVTIQATLSWQTKDHDKDNQRLIRAETDGQNSEASGVIPNDELFPEQWHLHNTGQFGYTPNADINAPEAWEITTGDPNVIIAICDTGVELNHPDLVNNMVPGYDFYDGDDDPSPAEGENESHGTMCAGFASAQGNNGIGVTGVTWNCKIMPIRMRIFTHIPRSAVADGIRWAAANGADILNHSWGTYNDIPVVQSAMIDVTKPGGIGRNGKGCVIVACAGNDNKRLFDPARFPEVIAVGATDHNDNRLDFSNYGPELEIMAPSGRADPPWTLGIWTTDVSGTDGYSNYNRDPNITYYTEGCAGTSVSAPIVAGVAALILSVEPELTNEEVRHFLTRSAKDLGEPGRDNYYGWGRVDARAALDMVLAKRADLSDNWIVDMEDLLILIDHWKTSEPSADIAPATKRDGFVDDKDLELFMQYWQTRIPIPGLLAHWRLDETEGTVAYDSAGEKDIFLSGEQLWRPDEGKIGGALELDGIDDYAGTSPILNPADGAFSVFAWIKGGAPGQVMISQTDGFSGGSGGTWLGIDSSDGKLMTGLVPYQNLSLLLDSQIIITDGQWHHIGFIWDGSYRSLCVDGVEVAKDAMAVESLQSSDGSLYIGVDKNVDPSSFFSGMLDDIRIYNRALTTKQIETLSK